jgi:hypothetical protein
MGRSVSPAIPWVAKRNRLSKQLGVHDASRYRWQRVEPLEPGRSRPTLTRTISTRPRSRFDSFVPGSDRTLDPWSARWSSILDSRRRCRPAWSRFPASLRYLDSVRARLGRRRGALRLPGQQIADRVVRFTPRLLHPL